MHRQSTQDALHAASCCRQPTAGTRAPTWAVPSPLLTHPNPIGESHEERTYPREPGPGTGAPAALEEGPDRAVAAGASQHRRRRPDAHHRQRSRQPGALRRHAAGAPPAGRQAEDPARVLRAHARGATGAAGPQRQHLAAERGRPAHAAHPGRPGARGAVGPLPPPRQLRPRRERAADPAAAARRAFRVGRADRDAHVPEVHHLAPDLRDGAGRRGAGRRGDLELRGRPPASARNSPSG